MVPPKNRKLRKLDKRMNRQSHKPHHRLNAPQPQDMHKLNLEFNKQALEYKTILMTRPHLLTRKHPLVVNHVLEAHCRISFFKLDNYILRRFLYDTDIGLDWSGFLSIRKLTLTLTLDLYSPPTSLEELFHGAAQEPHHQVLDLMFLLSPMSPVRALGGRKYNKYSVWQDHMQNLEVFNLNLLAKGDRAQSDWKLDGKLNAFVGMVQETEIVLRAKTGRVKVLTQCSSGGEDGKSVWEEHWEEGSKMCKTAEKLATVFWGLIKAPESR